jgi:O-antigen/teichoic acid export membrane protein
LTKKFTQSIFILLFLNLLVKPFWIFGIDRTIQNRVGAEEYGLFFSLFGFSLLFNMVNDFGITNANNRYISRNPGALNQRLGTVVPVKMILAFAYAFLTLVSAWFIDYSPRQLYLIIFLIFNQIIISFSAYLRSNITALQLFITDSIISVIDKLLLICICSIFLWGNFMPSFKIEWLIYIQTFSYLSSLIVSLLVVLKKSGRLSFYLDKKSFFGLLGLSYPYAILAILMILYSRIDAVMIERMLPNGLSEAGIYAQAFRVNDALSMFAMLFASILLPMFSKMFKENQPVGAILTHSFALLMVPSLAVVISLIFNSTQFMELLYISHSQYSSEILRFLLIGFLGICPGVIFGTLLTAAGKLKWMNQIAFGALLTNMVMNFWLIPFYGALGAAVSFMVTQLMVGIIQAFIAIRWLKLKIRFSVAIRYALLTIMLILLSALLYGAGFEWYWSVFANAFLVIILAILFKILRIENFRQIFKSSGEQ